MVSETFSANCFIEVDMCNILRIEPGAWEVLSGHKFNTVM